MEEFNPIRVFNKLFVDDINYLISMKNLWEKRRQPIPIEYEKAHQIKENNQNDSEQSITPKLNDQRVQTISEYVQMFMGSLIQLKQRSDKQRQITNKETRFLIWDKNDDIDLRFATSSANLRAYIFGINLTSKFDVKSMAGNIIPAVATTNAIVAGITVLQARKILSLLPRSSTSHPLTSIKQLTNVFISTDRKTGAIIQPIPLEEPNPQCYQCNNLEEPVRVKLNMSLFTLHSLYEYLIRHHLKMYKPDVYIDDGSNRVLISADDEDDDDNHQKMSKTLDQFKLFNGTILLCDEEFDKINEISNTRSIQHRKIKLILEHTDTIINKNQFIIIDDHLRKEINQTTKRKLLNEDDEIEHSDDYQNELNIVKKTKRLLTNYDEHNNPPIHTSFTNFVNDSKPEHTNGYHHDASETDLNVNTK
jgi:ubiquitin-like 1-activating enzyme E1 B